MQVKKTKIITNKQIKEVEPTPSNYKQFLYRMIDQDFVCICQAPRTGSTLLLRLFDGHPEILSWPIPFGFGENKIWPSVKQSAEKRVNTFNKLYGQFDLQKFNYEGWTKKSSNRKQETIDIDFSKFRAETLLDILPLKAEDLKETNKKALNIVFTTVFNSWINYKNIYGDKKWVLGHQTLARPELYRDNYLSFINNNYNNGVMITGIRNPSDWLYSISKLKNSNNNNLKTKGDMLNYYIILYSMAHEMAGIEKQLIFLDFDDLISVPEEAMRSLLSKLDLEWSNHCLFTTANMDFISQNSSSEDIKTKFQPDYSIRGKGKNIYDSLDSNEKILFNKAEKIYCKFIGNCI